MYKETVKAASEKMDKTIAVIQKELSTLRAGRANPKILARLAKTGGGVADSMA